MHLFANCTSPKSEILFFAHRLGWSSFVLWSTEEWLDSRVSCSTARCVKQCFGKSWPDIQGRNEVRWRPGQEVNLAPPWSNMKSFGSKCTVLKKVLVTFLGLFDPLSDSSPHSYLSPGELCPPCPSLRPCRYLYRPFYFKTRNIREWHVFLPLRNFSPLLICRSWCLRHRTKISECCKTASHTKIHV